MSHPSEFLDRADIKTLADTADIDKQAIVLERLGIPYRLIGRRILVSRHHTREWLAGRVVTPSRGVDLSKVR